MKIKYLSLLLILLLLPTSGMAQEREPNKIIIGIFHNPPYSFMKDGELIGIFGEMVKEIIVGMDLEIVASVTSFSRNIDLMEKGEVDAFVGMIKTPAREEILYYCDPLIKEFTIKSFYVKKGSGVVINKYEDLYNYTIGISRGVVNFDKFDDDSNIKKEAATQYIQNIQKLAAGRIDAFIQTEVTADYMININGFSSQIEKAKFQSESSSPVYFAISKKSPHMKNVELFEKNLKRLFDQKWYSKELDKWIK